MTVAVVLASRSPRRLDLLAQLGITPEVVPADIDESPLAGESPLAMVRRLASAKADVVMSRIGTTRDAQVLAADTTVDLDGENFGQPIDEADAARMLRRLSGRTHRVHTAVAVAQPGVAVPTVEVVTSLVTFQPLNDHVVEWYVGTGEPMGKAGAYAVQGLGGTLVASVKGSWSNVVGLPLAETARLLGLGPAPVTGSG
ncbi:MAG: Maf family protein [Ilumatobacteraceae bacterium]